MASTRHAPELAEALVRRLRDGAGADVRLALYVESDGQLELIAHAGCSAVVQRLPAGSARPGRAVLMADGDIAAEVRTTFAAEVHAFDDALDRPEQRRRDGDAADDLSWALVRLARHTDPADLLLAACGVVAGLVGVETAWTTTASDVLSWRLDGAAAHPEAVEDTLAIAAGSSLAPIQVPRPERALDPERLTAAELVGSHVATVHASLERYHAIVVASLTDALTGLPNHRRFHEDGAALIDACRATGEEFTLVVADLDDFKDLNDRRGHVAGDDALRLVGRLLEGGVRPDDRAYRVGGEEFALLLPGASKANARTVCRRLQRALAAQPVDGWKLTCSLGVAGFPEDGETVRDLLASADAALYEAKRLGKDRITLADERLLARRTQGDSMAARGRRSFEQMRHLQQLAVALGAARTVAAIGAVVLAELAVALPHDAGAVIFDGEIVARDGPSADAGLRGLAAQAETEGRAFLVDDVAEVVPAFAGGPLHGAVAAPFAAGRGALVIVSALPSRFDRDDERLLEVIATVAGLACANVRLVTSEAA